MAVAGAGKHRYPHEYSSASSAPALTVFIPTSFGRIFARVSAHETVNNVIAHIAAHTRFPAVELRLHDECWNQLPGDRPIGLCGNSRLFRLSYPLLTTNYSGACALSKNLVYIVSQLLSSHGKQKPGLPVAFVDFFRKFARMIPTGREEDMVGHLHAFIFSGAHIALGMLHQSPLTAYRDLARCGLGLFLQFNRMKFPKSFDFQYLPILLELCFAFIKIAGRESPLYLQCRTAISSLLCSNKWTFFGHSNCENMMPVLNLFVVDLADEIIRNLYSETAFPASVHQLSTFLKQMRREIKDWKASYPFPESEHMDKQYVLYLYGVLKDLRMKLADCLGKIESFTAEKSEQEVKSLLRKRIIFLDVLFCFHKLCKIVDADCRLVRALFFARRSPLNALIRHAEKNDKYYWLLGYKEALDFEEKKRLLMMLFAERLSGPHTQDYYLTIDRLHLLSESFMHIGQVDAQILHGELSVIFTDEEATGHGVTREWLYLVCQEVFSSQTKLFSPCQADRRRFFPNPASSLDPTQLEYYKFAGRLVALALRHQLHIGITFDRIFFLQLAGKEISLEDIRYTDPVLYTSCKKVLEMDDELLDSDALGLTFVREIEQLGSRKTVAICQGGEEIAVNSSNKGEFIDLLVKSYYVESLSKQIHHFSEGFRDMLSNVTFEKLFFRSLYLKDFDRLLRGSEEEIDINDWKKHTIYGGYEVDDPQIVSFWKVVEGMQEEQRRILLQFWTAIRFLPVGGFCKLPKKLYISNSFDTEEEGLPLPTSQTCFYQLQLPPYPSFSIMHEKLHLITQEHVCCTFGLY